MMALFLLGLGGFLFIFGFIGDIPQLQTLFVIYLVFMVICLLVAHFTEGKVDYPDDSKPGHSIEEQREFFDSELNNFRDKF